MRKENKIATKVTHDGPSFPSNEANSEESRKLKPVIIGHTKVAYTDIPSQMLRHTSCTNAAACFVFFFFKNKGGL